MGQPQTSLLKANTVASLCGIVVLGLVAQTNSKQELAQTGIVAEQLLASLLKANTVASLTGLAVTGAFVQLTASKQEFVQMQIAVE